MATFRAGPRLDSGSTACQGGRMRTVLWQDPAAVGLEHRSLQPRPAGAGHARSFRAELTVYGQGLMRRSGEAWRQAAAEDR